MSYPDPKYVGATGEVSAIYRRTDTPPDLGVTRPSIEYLASSGMTGGGFGLYRYNFGATPSGPGPHFHRTISESFYILDGTVRLYNGEEWIDAVAGDFLYVPEGGIHGFRNESGMEATMLLMFAPGAPREEYFEALAANTPAEMTEEQRADFYLRHDNIWV